MSLSTSSGKETSFRHINTTNLFLVGSALLSFAAEWRSSAFIHATFLPNEPYSSLTHHQVSQEPIFTSKTCTSSPKSEDHANSLPTAHIMFAPQAPDVSSQTWIFWFILQLLRWTQTQFIRCTRLISTTLFFPHTIVRKVPLQINKHLHPLFQGKNSWSAICAKGCFPIPIPSGSCK